MTPEQRERARRCLHCRKALKPAWPGDEDEDSLQPSGGLICRSYGNYGSRLYDPPGTGLREWLEFLVCDDCMTAAAKAGLVRRGTETPRLPPSFEAWPAP